MKSINRRTIIAAFATLLALLLASACAVASPLADGIGGWVNAERLGEIPNLKSQISIKSQITNHKVDERSAQADSGLQVESNFKDGKGNRIEVWATSTTFKVKFIYANGRQVWIAACKYADGRNKFSVNGQQVGTPVGQPGEIESYHWENKDGGDNDGKIFNGVNHRTITFDFDPKANNGNGEVTKTYYDENGKVIDSEKFPAPTDPNGLNPWPPSPHGVCYVYPAVNMSLSSVAQGVWDYQIDIPDRKLDFFVDKINPGDKVCIAGGGIVGAGVTGQAASRKYGAWIVKECTDTHVIFEATEPAYIDASFQGFRMFSSNAVEGMVPWTFNGTVVGGGGFVRGPAASRD